MAFNYHGRDFRVVSSTAGDLIIAGALFQFQQDGSSVWATYSGDALRFGSLIGAADEQDKLTFDYHHLGSQGEVWIGKGYAAPEALPDGCWQLYVVWQQTVSRRPDAELFMEEVEKTAQTRQYAQDEYTISTDSSQLDVDAIHAYITQSYWAAGRPKEVVRHSLRHSLCFGLFHQFEQIGFARIITDFATFAYLCDVYILEEHRGRGLGKWLIEVVTDFPELSGIRRWTLATRDAHELYIRYGFRPLSAPERQMELIRKRMVE